jgi:peroxiredoxin
MDELINSAWAEASAFFRRMQAGEATRADDPQPRLAQALYEAWLKARDEPDAQRALTAAFMMWGNVGDASPMERALPHLDRNAPYWGAVLHGLGRAYHGSGRREEFLAMMHTLEGELTDGGSRCALAFDLARVYLHRGDLEKSAEYYQQVLALAKRPTTIAQAEDALHEIARLQPGQPAPDFTAETLEGGTIRLSEFRGKVVLLDFWATDCGFCWPEMPFLRRVNEAHASDLILIGISKDSDREKLLEVVENERLAWPQVWEPSVHETERFELGPIARAYNAWGVPRTVLVDRDGRVISKDLRGEPLVSAVQDAVASGPLTY